MKPPIKLTVPSAETKQFSRFFVCWCEVTSGFKSEAIKSSLTSSIFARSLGLLSALSYRSEVTQLLI